MSISRNPSTRPCWTGVCVSRLLPTICSSDFGSRNGKQRTGTPSNANSVWILCDQAPQNFKTDTNRRSPWPPVNEPSPRAARIKNPAGMANTSRSRLGA